MRWCINVRPDVVHQVVLGHRIAIDLKGGLIYKRGSRHPWIERHVVRKMLRQVDNAHVNSLLFPVQGTINALSRSDSLSNHSAHIPIMS
jgi:hypothetical protein